MTKNRYTIPIICDCGNDLNKDGDYQARDPFLKYTHLFNIGETDTNVVLDSISGFRFYDIDGFCWNKKTNNAFMIESKSKMKYPTDDQQLLLSKLDYVMPTSFNWKGTFLFRYEKMNPKDGLTIIHKMNGVKFGEIVARLNYEDLYKCAELLLNTDMTFEQIMVNYEN
jgi:hypothetical protein